MNILYITRSIVDTEHIIPLYNMLKKNTPNIKQYVCLLNLNSKNIYENEAISRYLDKGSLLYPYTFVKKKFLRNILRILWIFNGMVMESINKFTIVKKAKVALLSILSGKIINFLSRYVDFFFDKNVDFIILPENAYMQVIKNNNKNCQFYSIIAPVFLNRNVKVIVVPETYDPFPEVPEFVGCTGDMIPNISYFFSRGDKLKLANTIPVRNVVDIGTPRYSENWCKVLNASSQPVNVKTKRNILYLATKNSPAYPDMEELIEKMNREVFLLLEQYNELNLYIKPHPRTSDYRCVKKYTKHSNRVFVYRTRSAVDLAKICDIIITPGTSFIPHLLWMQKPVILLKDLTSRYKYSYHVEKYCFELSDFDFLYKNKIYLGEDSYKEIKTGLNSLFQLGLSDEKYQAHIKHICNTIFK